MSILRTVRRAAVAGAVHGKIQRRQHDRWAATNQAAPAAIPTTPPPAQVTPAAPVDVEAMIAQLERLGALRDSGVITEAEFETQKARLLS